MDSNFKVSFSDIVRMRRERIAGALFYARRGFYVFPCCDPGMAPHKHSGRPCTTPGKGPLIQWGEGATVDPATIARLWYRWPTANIAIVTGAKSGIVVIDIDPRNGGLGSWAALIKQFGALEPTWTVRSGGNGIHYYFRHPGATSNRIQSRPVSTSKATAAWSSRRRPFTAAGESMSGSEQGKLAPPAAAPEWLKKEQASANGKPPPVAPVEPDGADRIIPIGERHAFLVRLTGLLRSWGVARKAAHAAALADYQERWEKDESTKEQEVANIIATVDDVYNRYPAEAPAETDRPQIVVNVGQLRDKVTQSLAALKLVNDPPTLFTRGGFLTRLGRGNDGVLDLLDADGLLAELAEAADWKKRADEKLRDAEPSSNIVRAIRGRRSLPFPPIEGVARAPFFSADGELIVDPGYDPRTRTYLALDPKLASQLAALSFPDHPTDTEVTDARALVLEPFAQFPFADSASLANTTGLTLIPFGRKMISGLVPIHGATAPPEAAGTGKSILVQTACVPGVGEVDSTPEVGNADELRKKLLPVIINDLPVFMFDNLTEELSGGVLASILTTRNLAERILGHSKLFRGQVHTAFVFTANGARVSTEIRRRTNWIRLDAGMAEPWKRTGFTKELPAWAFEHRAELIRACVMLVRHWIDVGRPAGTVVLGGFEPWSRVIGGILQCAGIEGFLTNLDDARAYDSDVGAAHWQNFIQAWHADHDENPVVAGALIESAIACSIVKEVFDFDAARRERSIATKLGVAITYHLGQTFAIDSVEFTITRASVQRAGGRTNPGFALVQAKPAEKVREVRETGQKPAKPLKTRGNFSPDLSKRGQGKKSKSAKVRGAQALDSKGKSRISPDLPDVPDLFGRSGKRKKKDKF